MGRFIAGRGCCSERIRLVYQETAYEGEMMSELPVPTEDFSKEWSDEDIAALVAECNVDQSVRAVTHTRGGSSYG